MGFQAVRPGEPYHLGHFAQQVAGLASKGLSKPQAELVEAEPGWQPAHHVTQ